MSQIVVVVVVVDDDDDDDDDDYNNDNNNENDERLHIRATTVHPGLATLAYKGLCNSLCYKEVCL